MGNRGREAVLRRVQLWGAADIQITSDGKCHAHNTCSESDGHGQEPWDRNDVPGHPLLVQEEG